MANGAFTLQGFESPEEVQARIGKAKQAAFRPQGDINQMIYQTAAQGASGVGGALAQALGYEDPQVKAAREVQSVLSGMDMSTSKGYYEAAQKLNDAGQTKQALFLASRGNELAKIEGTKASTAKPTTSLKKMNELIAQGIPNYVAQGVGYSMYREATDPDGNVYITDLRQAGARVPDDVAEHLKRNDLVDKPYQPKIVIKGNKPEIRLQKAVKDLSKDIISSGVPRTEGILDAIEASIDKHYGSDDPESEFFREADKKGDLPGFGRTAMAPDWVVSTDAQDLRQSIVKLFNIELAERSGAAVTKQELDRLADEFKRGAWRTDRQLVQGIKAYRGLLEAYKKSAFAGYDQKVVDRYTEQGGVRIKREPSKPSSTKKNIRPKVTEAQIRADGKKNNWTEEQIQSAIKKYVGK